MMSLWGFTILELIVVVVIIGILASIAIPQYNLTMERARQAEAKGVLGAMRGAQLRYIDEYKNYTSNTSLLDVGLPTYGGVTDQGRYFSYTIDPSVTNDTLAAATRRTDANSQNALYGNYTMVIAENGTITVTAAGGFEDPPK